MFATAALTFLPGTSLTFSAAMLPGNTGSANAEGRAANQQRDAQGFLSYGGYVDLPPGLYRVTFGYRANGPGHKWDLVSDAGRAFLAEGALTATDGIFQQFQVEIELMRAAHQFEARSYFSGQGHLAISDISIALLSTNSKTKVAPSTTPSDQDAVPPHEDTFPVEELHRSERRRWVLDYCSPGGIGAEFGVFRGHFAEVLTRVLSPRILYLVDPWTQQGEHFVGFHEDWVQPYVNMGRLTTRQALAETKQRLARFAKSTELHICEQRCEDFCRDYLQQGKQPLDFIYLDTSHSFDDTREQLQAAAQILATDGLILGDDWTPERGHVHHGVFQAIHEFLRQAPFELVAAGPYGQFCLRRRV